MFVHTCTPRQKVERLIIQSQRLLHGKLSSSLDLVRLYVKYKNDMAIVKKKKIGNWISFEELNAMYLRVELLSEGHIFL